MAAMELWLAHVYRYSRRDQLSANFAFHQAGLTPGILHIDNFRSRFHSWPHATERKSERRSWQPDPAVGPIGARRYMWAQQAAALTVRNRQPKRPLAERARRLKALLRSTTWRMMKLARVLARSLVTLARR